MRRRLTVAMVLMVFGALVLAGLASLALVVHNTTTQTRRELVREAQGLAVAVQSQAQAANRADPAKALRTLLLALKSPLRLEGSAVVAVGPGGNVFDPATPRLRPTLPSGLEPGDIHLSSLLAGSTVSGTKGSVVYAAAPYRAQVQILGSPRQVLQVVVLTRRPPSPLAGAGLWFALSSLVILAAAVVVARRLGRRFVRPLESARDVTGRIAAGDLAARVPDPPGTDVELVALAGSINAMAESLARAKGAERQFLLSVSHDLRTPLTSIRGFAEAIEDGLTTNVGSAAAVIASQARRLERLVSDLLALASLEARRFTLELQPVDLTQVATSTATAFTPAAIDMGLSLVVEPTHAGAVGATADPDRLAQVTANLIENALRYATHEVRVAACNGVGDPELWVSDDGPGMAAEDVALAFERPFMRRSRPDRPIGSGLGLAIVGELVAAMGGSVRAESPLGSQGGTRMVITLPPAPAPA